MQLAAGRIEYRGKITEQSNAQARALYVAADPKPTSLWIESQGGSTRAGIELGEWIFAQRLDVEIDTFCFSSCASYVFTAGAHKQLSAHASLLWHGGPTQPMSPAEQEQLLESTLQAQTIETRGALEARYTRAQLLTQLQHSLEELIALETQFFAAIRVDQRLTTLGQLHTPITGGPFLGWDYSLEDLAKLGVRNVRLKDGMWQPQFPLNGRIYRLELSTLADFEPSPLAAPPRGE